ncbi:MAG: 50S ribosomal protein L15 [Alphaproteobacteria bacterium]
MKLNELRDNPGATTTRKRVGRGVGSGLGKTSGHGQKGQKSRTGVALNGFEGGQMATQWRFAKRGFKRTNFSTKHLEEVVNLGRIEKAIQEKKLHAEGLIDAGHLKQAGLIRKETSIVRLLAKGTLTTKIKIKVQFSSKSAQAMVEKAGGEVLIEKKLPVLTERKLPVKTKE